MTLSRYVLDGPTKLLLSSGVQIKEVYDLLSLNYVEDGEANFRFKYSAEFLEWYTYCSVTAEDKDLTSSQGPQATGLPQRMAHWR